MIYLKSYIYQIHANHINRLEATNPANGEVYSIQHYVIKFVNDFKQVGGFSPGTPVSSTSWPPRYNWNIVESGVKHHNPNPNNINPLIAYAKIMITIVLHSVFKQ
jgi:hypothetical protein